MVQLFDVFGTREDVQGATYEFYKRLDEGKILTES